MQPLQDGAYQPTLLDDRIGYRFDQRFVADISPDQIAKSVCA
jgi:hypothetical protein